MGQSQGYNPKALGADLMGPMRHIGPIDHAKRVDFFAKPRCIHRGEQRKTERLSNA
jgi:hypothetical protein